jgi:hypothetical protein
MTHSLQRLVPLTPDAGRREHLRARCRAQLERRMRPKRNRMIGPAVVGGLFVLYTAALVLNTLRLEGVLH